MESDPSNPQCVEGSDIIQIDRQCAGYDGVEECARDATWSQWSEVNDIEYKAKIGINIFILVFNLLRNLWQLRRANKIQILH